MSQADKLRIFLDRSAAAALKTALPYPVRHVVPVLKMVFSFSDLGPSICCSCDLQLSGRFAKQILFFLQLIYINSPKCFFK